MGYTAAMVLASIFLAPIILLAALPLQWISWRAGSSPGGVGGFVSYLLIVCSGYALLYVGTTAQMLVWEPARLQAEYIGKAVAGPTSLIFFRQSGFQDPASEWRYRLSPAQSAELRRRCRDRGAAAAGPACSLFSGQDERWFADVELEGNELRMIDGLW